MKYVKTKDGCITKGNFELGKTILTVWGEETITKENSADSIEELIEEKVLIEKDGQPTLLETIDFDRNIYLRINEYEFGRQLPSNQMIYGAIWTTGEHGEPILKSIAKMNNDGELELLYE